MISRRHFVTGLGLGILGASIEPAMARETSRAEQVVETWMNTWIEEQKSREPVGALHLGRFVEPMYYLLQPITWKPNAGQESYREVTVPVGFVTDLASIPRVFFSLLRPDGTYTYPAIVHDYLYWTQERSREDSDMILKLGMQDFAVGGTTVATIYNAVRKGGRASWRNNARRKRAGEKRVLREFPSDPRTRWQDWRKKDVFV